MKFTQLQFPMKKIRDKCRYSSVFFSILLLLRSCWVVRQRSHLPHPTCYQTTKETKRPIARGRTNTQQELFSPSTIQWHRNLSKQPSQAYSAPAHTTLADSTSVPPAPYIPAYTNWCFLTLAAFIVLVEGCEPEGNAPILPDLAFR